MDVQTLDGVRTQVMTFGGGCKQGAHRDSRSRVSIVLRGAVAEDSAWGSVRLEAGDILFKSREVVHEDRFGPEGAAIFSIFFDDDADCPFGAQRLSGAWIRVRSEPALALGMAVMEAAAARDATGLRTAIADLLAIVRTPLGRGGAPAWLVEIYRLLQDQSLAEINMGEQARARSRHPVTLSRDFRRHFGVTITEHAARQSVRRALVALAHGETDLAAIALDAGFYDQSHMNRVFKRVTTRAPGAHRALLAAAAAG